MRGLRQRGSIPACAGEPRRPPPRLWSPRVYPRVCGGTAAGPPVHPPVAGLSPRVRGNRGYDRPVGQREGSIPACAGEPIRQCHRARLDGVYPRVCGGTILDQTIIRPRQGLSPRVRGNPSSGCGGCGCPGSIPACAGEPHLAGPRGCGCGVYPRVCGGTVPDKAQCRAAGGLSPRVRGNRCAPTG